MRQHIRDIIGLEERLQKIASEQETEMAERVLDLDEVGSLTYVGKIRGSSSAVWIVELITDLGSGDLSKRYANQENNPTITSYDSAWSQRDTLVYGK